MNTAHSRRSAMESVVDDNEFSLCDFYSAHAAMGTQVASSYASNVNDCKLPPSVNAQAYQGEESVPDAASSNTEPLLPGVRSPTKHKSRGKVTFKGVAYDQQSDTYSAHICSLRLLPTYLLSDAAFGYDKGVESYKSSGLAIGTPNFHSYQEYKIARKKELNELGINVAEVVSAVEMEKHIERQILQANQSLLSTSVEETNKRPSRSYWTNKVQKPPNQYDNDLLRMHHANNQCYAKNEERVAASVPIDRTPSQNSPFIQQKVRPGSGNWSNLEDEMLNNAVDIHSAKNWKKIASMIPGRSEVQCLHRYQKVLRPGLVKGNWTEGEDAMILEHVQNVGARKWSLIAAKLQGRIGKQCRERYFNNLDPSIKKGDWAEEEDEIIIRSVKEMGGKWSAIRKLLPGRTDNAIKNRYNCSLKSRVEGPEASRRVRKRSPSKPDSNRPPKRTAGRNIMQVSSDVDFAASALSNLASPPKSKIKSDDMASPFSDASLLMNMCRSTPPSM